MPVSLLPPLVGAYLPPPSVDLPDTERDLIVGLATKLTYLTPLMVISDNYYNGTQRLTDLGVSIPPALLGIRTVVDWPRICVDPLVQRCIVDGFRLPNTTETDTELDEQWAANGMDAEAPLCFVDALALRCGYMIVGSPDTAGDSPVVTVESPFNVVTQWDPRTRQTTSAYQSYEVEGVYRAVLYTPDVTVQMSRDQTSPWQVDDRDEHGLGEVPVVKFANRMRASEREGRSEITPAVMNTTDSAMRSLLGMEIAREFYSVPHRYILGASESDYKDPQGNPKSALDMVMSKFLAFERDEEGNAPTVGQFTAFDPSVFTKIVDTHAQLMASYTQFPPQYFGQVTTVNPASADSIRVSHDGMNRRGAQVQSQFTDPLRRVAGLIWRFANNAQPLPAEFRRLQVDWADVATPTPAATSDAVFKQVQMGYLPATSDVTGRKLGYSAVERARIEADRAKDVGEAVLAELASSLEAKQARADVSIAKDIQTTEPNVPPGSGS